MKSSALNNATGALKLALLQLDLPAVVSQAQLRSAALSAIEQLQSNAVHIDDLGRLYSAVLAVTPRFHLPHVTLTNDERGLYGVVITDRAGNVIDRQTGKTIEGLTQLIATRLQPLANNGARA